MTYRGSFLTWLAAVPGFEDIEAEADERAHEIAIRERRACWPCGGTGLHDRWHRNGPRLEDGGHFTYEVCPHCHGSGLDIELGVAG